jgi:nucleotide-binding universal stress UspA family protein
MAAERPILVPLDGSTAAENALPLAAWYSRVTGAPLQFIHVLDSDTKPEARAHAAEVFQSYASGLGATHHLGEIECQVLVGSPADQVLSACVTAAAIAIATHGRGGFRAMVLGSTADKIIRGAVVPVLVEPGTEKSKPPSSSRPILVGLDGSEEAELGLVAARALAAKDGLKVVLFRAFHIPPPVGIEFAAYPGDLSSTLEEAARDYLARTGQPGEQTVLAQGDAASALLQAAEELNAGLIVLTSSGKGLTKRIALGSTTDRVIHGTERAVLVVPPAATSD